MEIVLLLPPQHVPSWQRAMAERVPPRWVCTAHGTDLPPSSSASYAVAWRPPLGVWEDFPHLKAIFSMGAGVEHLLQDPALPDIPIVRVVEEDLTERMVEYIVFQTLFAHRQGFYYQEAQRKKRWSPSPQGAAREVCVGILGHGVLGKACGQALHALGFQVLGWKRTPEKSPGKYRVFFAHDGLVSVLSKSNILICLLPHTDETEGFLNKSLLQKLPQNPQFPHLPHVINAGRGKVHVERDLIEALDEGVIQGLCLDVFEQEPLPKNSALWSHPRVFVTPHVAADSSPLPISKGIVAQIKRHEKGLSLRHTVSRSQGY